jgi:hypothetical protein
MQLAAPIGLGHLKSLLFPAFRRFGESDASAGEHFQPEVMKPRPVGGVGF